MTGPMIAARALTKRFGPFVAVDGIDFTIEPGEAFGFLGPNGAGKTSTMRMIGCVSPRSGGQLSVLGLDPTFPLKYMVYFLLVVAVGGVGTIKGPLVAAVILGIFDVAGKYYVPQVGAFVIYVLMVVLLLFFPAGLYGRRA